MTGDVLIFMILASLVLALIGLVLWRYPLVIWKYTARFKSRNADGPSDLYLFGSKVSAVAFFIAILFLWLNVLANP